jgi:hypothetical protein
MFLGGLDGFVIHVRQVHDLSDFETSVFQPSSQYVLEDEGSEVTDVTEVVDCGPASVHFDFAFFQRDEPLFCSRERVEKADVFSCWFHVFSVRIKGRTYLSILL